MHISHSEAWDMVTQSTVKNRMGSYSLPFGFVQSPILSSLALDRSALGRCLRSAKRRGVRLSVYVDDIIMSSPSEMALRGYLGELECAAEASGYVLNDNKRQLSALSVEAFNLLISHQYLKVTSERIKEFESVTRTADLARELAIVGYVGTVDQSQAGKLAAFYGI